MQSPATAMPVTSSGRCRDGDHDLMTDPGCDLVVATRTSVRLVRLVRLHVSDVHLGEVVPVRHAARALAEERPQHERDGEDDCATEEHEIGAPRDVLAIGVVAHCLTLAIGMGGACVSDGRESEPPDGRSRRPVRDLG